MHLREESHLHLIVSFLLDTYSLAMNNYGSKEISLNMLRTTLSNIEKETETKQQDVNNNNAQLKVTTCLFPGLGSRVCLRCNSV